MDESGGEKNDTTAPPPSLPEGPNTELLHIGGVAALHLVCGGGADSVSLIRRGDFSILSSKKPSTPFSFLSCAVSDHHWPLSSDSPVLRLSPKRFSFSFPTFFYCLTLPDHCSDHHLSELISIFMSFCNFQDVQDKFVNSTDSAIDSEEAFWVAAYMKINSNFSPSPPLSMVEQRALRVSAATKLVARVIVQEAVDPERHFEISGGGGAAKSCVVAGIKAVAEVVSAVEAAGEWSSAAGKTAGWRFSAAGLELVLRVVAAVTARTGGASATVENRNCRIRRSACRSSMT